MNTIFRSYRAVCSYVPELIQTERLTGQFATSVPEQIEVSEPLSSAKSESLIAQRGCTVTFQLDKTPEEGIVISAINIHQVLDHIKYGLIGKLCSHVKSLMGKNIIHLYDRCWRT